MKPRPRASIWTTGARIQNAEAPGKIRAGEVRSRADAAVAATIAHKLAHVLQSGLADAFRLLRAAAAGEHDDVELLQVDRSHLLRGIRVTWACGSVLSTLITLLMPSVRRAFAVKDAHLHRLWAAAAERWFCRR
jgi:hypothetical protein